MAFTAFPNHELAALGTALCWALSSLISAAPAAYLGALSFNRLRQASVTVMLAILVFTSGRWQEMAFQDVALLLASGVVGIFMGDTLLFLALNRLGPRRNSIVFALNAPLAAILGWLLLGESLSFRASVGIALCVFGVMLAILFGKRQGQTHRFEDIKGPLWIGLCLGLGAALGQALGTIMVRPLMAAGIDPFVASMLRVGTAALCLSALMMVPMEVTKQRNVMTWKMAGITGLTGILAMGVGMTLLLFALSGGKTGVISTLSATSPVMILPMLWLLTGERPAAGAWAGAGLVIVGMALLFAGR